LTINNNTNNNNQINIAQQKKRKGKMNTGMIFFFGIILNIIYDGFPSSGSLSECHWAIGRRGDASISDQ
jgi:hypothetical protein